MDTHSDTGEVCVTAPCLQAQSPWSLNWVISPKKSCSATDTGACWVCSFPSNTCLVRDAAWFSSDSIDIPQSKQVLGHSSSAWQHRGAKAPLLRMRWENSHFGLFENFSPFSQIALSKFGSRINWHCLARSQWRKETNTPLSNSARDDRWSILH